MDQNQNYQNQNQNQNYQNQNQNQNYQNQNQGQNYQNQNQGQNYRSANNTQVPPAAPVTPADPVTTPKAKSKKPLIIAIIAIIVVAALAVGAYFLLQGKDSNKQGNQTPSIDDIGSRAPDEISTFALYPDSDVDKSDLEEFSELINERVQLLGTDNKLTSGKDYRIDVEDERIILTIVKDLLGNTPAEKTAIVDLLISKGNLCFGVDGYALTSTPHKDAVAETSVTEVNRKDILEEYGDDIMTERYDQLEALSEDTLYALEVELTTDGEEDYLYTFNYFSGKPTVVHNFVEGIVSAETEYVSFLGTCLTPDEDEPGTLLIISPGSTSENTAELMKMVIEQDEMPFGLAMQIEDEPAWEEKAAVYKWEPPVGKAGNGQGGDCYGWPTFPLNAGRNKPVYFVNLLNSISSVWSVAYAMSMCSASGGDLSGDPVGSIWATYRFPA